MSFLNFAVFGLCSAQKAYLRTSFEEDQISVFGREGKLEGRVTRDIEIKPVGDDTTKESEKEAGKEKRLIRREIEIDNVVRIATVADEIRRENEGFWDHQHSITKGIFIGTLIGGLIAVGGAIALATQPHFWGVALAVAIVGVVLLGVSGLMYHRSQQALSEMNKWSDPALKISSERKSVQAADSLAFDSVFLQNMKARSLSSKEVKNLWEKRFEVYHQEVKTLLRFYESPDSDKRPLCQWVCKFLDDRLLGEEKIKYAFEDKISGKLRQAQESFSDIFQRYKSVDEKLKGDRDRIESHKHMLLQQNNIEQKIQAHDGLKAEIANYEDHLRTKERALETHSRTLIDQSGREIPGNGIGRDQEVQKIQNDILALKALIQDKTTLYEDLVRVINTQHEQNLQTIEANYKGDLESLEKNGPQQLYLDLFPEIYSLFSMYEGTDFRTQVNFQTTHHIPNSNNPFSPVFTASGEYAEPVPNPQPNGSHWTGYPSLNNNPYPNLYPQASAPPIDHPEGSPLPSNNSTNPFAPGWNTSYSTGNPYNPFQYARR